MGRTGGMHMGPDDPLFAGRSGMGRPGRPGMNPLGARYDPIGPPGMPVSLRHGLYERQYSTDILQTYRSARLALHVMSHKLAVL